MVLPTLGATMQTSAKTSRRVVRSPRSRLTDVVARVERFASIRGFSPRESQVFELLVIGFRQREIAELLDIKERTVKYHAARLRKKAGVESRYDLFKKLWVGHGDDA